MRWLARNSLIIALVLTIVAAVSSVAAFQPAGTPAAGTPISGTPIATDATNDAYFASPADLLDQIPSGEPSTVSVIGNGLVFQNQVFVAVRNNTSATVGSVSIAVSALDASGGLIAVGSSEQVVPAVIQPGGIGQSLIALQSPAPDGTAVQITVSAGPVPSYVSTAPLTITQATNTGSAIIGFAMNATGSPSSSPRFAISCWGADGSLVSYPAYTIFDGYSVPPGANAAFTASTASCDRFLVTAG